MSIKSVKSINLWESVIKTSYDIVPKGHNGEFKVESQQGEGTTLNIELPININ